MYNLTDQQKVLIRWLVERIREGKLNEEFVIIWLYESTSPVPFLVDFKGSNRELSEASITQGSLNILEASELIRCDITEKLDTSGRLKEEKRVCTVMQKAYDAVDTDFAAPDTSFITHLTPLADISGFDEQLKKRCVPILGAGGADPMLWDSAVRTAGVILEERLRDVGAISDSSCVGADLVNKVFTKQGTLASKFAIDSERQGYRDLYAGIVGAFRNPSAHRLIDPAPDEGGAFIAFVNLLLNKLESLR